jgi:hypothetical protein
MKARFKSLAALLVLTGLSAAAYADKTTTVNVAPTGSGTSFSGTINDTTGVTGSFTDVFQFSGAPMAADIAFTATAGTGITFTSLTLEYYPFVVADTVTPNTFSLTSTSASAKAYDQISGFYAWIVTGTSTSNTAKFTGSITENTAVTIAAAVPEPSSWALLLGGLGVMGLLSRKRMGTNRG